MSLHGVPLASEAEFRAYLEQNPQRLKPYRSDLPPRVGHPEFVGPLLASFTEKEVQIRYDADGLPFVLLHRDVQRITVSVTDRRACA
jgi:hypothetical protein